MCAAHWNFNQSKLVWSGELKTLCLKEVIVFQVNTFLYSFTLPTKIDPFRDNKTIGMSFLPCVGLFGTETWHLEHSIKKKDGSPIGNLFSPKAEAARLFCYKLVWAGENENFLLITSWKISWQSMNAMGDPPLCLYLQRWARWMDKPWNQLLPPSAAEVRCALLREEVRSVGGS